MDAWTAKWKEEGRDKFLTEEQKAKIQKAADDAKRMGIGDYTGYQERRDAFIKEQNDRGRLASNAALERSPLGELDPDKMEILRKAAQDPNVTPEEYNQLVRDVYAVN